MSKKVNKVYITINFFDMYAVSPVKKNCTLSETDQINKQKVPLNSKA